MSTAPPPVEEHYYQVVYGALVFAAVAGLAWLKNFFDGKKSGEPTPAPEIAGKAVGAAIIDKSAADVLTRIGDDVGTLRDIAERREKAEQEDDLLERAVERLRIEQDKGKPR